MDIPYKQIVEALDLTAEHRQHLKVQRGFPDEVIDKLKFKSCGPFIGQKPFFCNLPVAVYDALKTENVVIPYLDPTGEPYFIRPHKYGIKDLGIQVYIPYPIIGTDLKRLVIAESEYKAIASCIMGVPAIGIPGIASFSGSRFLQLKETIELLGAQQVVICFDNEIKGDTAYENFKKDYTKRYDTEFYAYIMATKLEKEKIETRIATLKNDWRTKGKADIDGILAAGVKPVDYQSCIQGAFTAARYRESWDFPGPHASFMERRIDRYFYAGPISEKFSSYFRKLDKEVKISNFTIDVVHTLYDQAQKAERLCRLRSKYGNSRPVLITPDMMSSLAVFNRFCFEMGDYEFEGDDKDLKRIWKYIFMNQDGRSVLKLSSYGHHDETGVWFFGNGAYFNDKFYPANDDGIVWVEDYGFKIPESPDKDFEAPILGCDPKLKISLKEILEHLGNILKPDTAKLILGWALGNFFMPEILKDFGVYPFLFFHGKKESGKSTIANWISQFFGFSQKGFNFHVSSIPGIARVSAQMSMIPVWLEEYRNKDPDIGKKNNFLRSIYDHSMIVKGTKKEDEVKTYKPRSTIILSGEEHPQDAALNSRCLRVSIYRDSTKKDDNQGSYEWLQKYKSNFRIIGHELLTNKNELWPKIKVRIGDYLQSFAEDVEKVGDRNKIHMSIIAGVMDVLVGESEDFSIYVGETAQKMENKNYDEEALYIYFEDLLNLYAAGKSKAKIVRRVEEDGKEVVYFWHSLAYAEWEMQYKGLRNDLPASREALREHLTNEMYYVDTKQCRIGDKTGRMIVLDPRHSKFPQHLNDLLNAYSSAGPEMGLF